MTRHETTPVPFTGSRIGSRRPPNRRLKFWDRVDRTDLFGCWPYTGPRTEGGYGITSLGSSTSTSAHRRAWLETFGPIPVGMVIRHDCDNPPCCNPSHLRIGTHADNIADKVARNRQAKGERNGRARLTIEQVREIRRRGDAGENPTTLAQEFGVSRRAIVYIIQRINWRDAA